MAKDDRNKVDAWGSFGEPQEEAPSVRPSEALPWEGDYDPLYNATSGTRQVVKIPQRLYETILLISAIDSQSSHSIIMASINEAVMKRESTIRADVESGKVNRLDLVRKIQAIKDRNQAKQTAIRQGAEKKSRQ